MNVYTMLFIEISLLFGTVFLIARTLYLRARREALMRKYTSPAARKNVEAMLSLRGLIANLLLAVTVICKIGYDTFEAVNSYGNSAYGQLLIVLLLSLSLSLIVLAAVYYVFKDNNLIVRP